MRGVPGVPGLVAWSSVKASKSFLLAAVSNAFVVVRARFAAVSCCRSVVSLAAAGARFVSAGSKRSMVPAGAGRTV